METLLMSCSELALWVKRLTEINMGLCSRFLKKKNNVPYLLNHQFVRMEKKNCVWNQSFLNVQWNSSF